MIATNSKTAAPVLAQLPALKEGDTIAVVAPSGPVPEERLLAGLARLKPHFQIDVASDIFRKKGFLAGDDKRRAEEFNRALRNPEVRAIWAARGGYGASRMIPYLDQDAMRNNPKVIVGFSDITALLCWAATLGFRSMHAPVVTQLADLTDEDCKWAVDMLLGRLHGSILAERVSGETFTSEGVLVGGNLSLLAHVCGTKWAPLYRDRLCILEDVGERSYALDRYLTQLFGQRKNSLSDARAVLLGDFQGCGDDEKDAIETLATYLRDQTIACGHGLPIGHGLRNRAFPFGANARLENGKLWLVDSVVS